MMAGCRQRISTCHPREQSGRARSACRSLEIVRRSLTYGNDNEASFDQ